MRTEGIGEGGHSAAAGCSEPDDDRPQSRAVVAGGADELQRMQYGAVAGQFIVLVKDVQEERAVARPVVHRFESDQGQASVDGQLRDLLVLHAVRPAPQDLPVAQFGEVLRQRFEQQDDVAVVDQLFAWEEPGDVWCQLLVRYPEVVAVAAFEVDVRPQVGVDPRDMQGMDRQPPLMFFARP
jgi:hypothetical protein